MLIWVKSNNHFAYPIALPNVFFVCERMADEKNAKL